MGGQSTLRASGGKRPSRGRLGLDEAGRGSVLGPLVVGAYLADEKVPDELLRELGVKDSKLLRPAARESLYGELRTRGKAVAFRAEPALIDRYVGKGRYNGLELEMMARLVVRLSPREVFADACDVDAARFARELERRTAARGWRGTIVARHKADRDLPIVGAASIVAKVVRDRAIARLQSESVRRLGSGYPSDPLTREFVRRHLSEGGPLPSCVRRSWATLDTLKSAPRLRALETFR